MKKRNLVIAGVVSLVLLCGCAADPNRQGNGDAKTNQTEGVGENSQSTDVSDANSDKVDGQADAQGNEDANGNSDVDGAEEEEIKEIQIPKAEDVIKFWAENFKDITDGKYSGDEKGWSTVSVVDYDDDTMPELVVLFSGDDYSTNIRYFDVSPLLDEPLCIEVEYNDTSDGKYIASFEPMLMAKNSEGEKHYIENGFYSEMEVSENYYEDIVFNEVDMTNMESFVQAPKASMFKSVVRYFDNTDSYQEIERDYLSGDGASISEEEYFGEFGVYAYVNSLSEHVELSNMYQQYLYEYTLEGNYDVDKVYGELLEIYKEYKVVECENKDPKDILQGTWKIIRTSIEGDESEWNPDDGEILLVFEGDKMDMMNTSFGFTSAYPDNAYTIEYFGYYDNYPWEADIESFGDYDWMNVRLDSEGHLNLMGIIRYGGSDYASIYYTFEKEQE